MCNQMTGRLATVLILALGCGTASDITHKETTANRECTGLPDEPVEVLDFANPTHALEVGSIAIVADGRRQRWVLGGMEVNVAADEEHVRTPRIHMEDSGDVPPPGTTVSLEMPVPVSLSNGGWGLLWVELEDSIKIVDTPSPYVIRRLLFARRSSEGWDEPITLLQSRLGGMYWEVGRTLRYSPDGEPWILVVGKDTTFWPEVMIGPVRKPLKIVPLGAGIQPPVAAFAFDSIGTVTLVALVASEGKSRFLLLESSDGGTSWTQPEAIWHPRLRPQRMRLHFDSEGNLHLLWSTSSDVIRHIMRPALGGGWIGQPMDNPRGVLFRWASGIGRCGRLTLIQEVMESPSGLGFHSARWTPDGGWSESGPLYPTHYGFMLFDGFTPDGNWYIGWSGDRESSSADAEVELKVWLASPQ